MSLEERVTPNIVSEKYQIVIDCVQKSFKTLINNDVTIYTAGQTSIFWDECQVR